MLSVTQTFDYTVNINLGDTTNVDTFDVYINDDFYGSDLSEILINTNDVLRIDITKEDNLSEASIKLNNELI